jgi:cell division septal protein FtsQ
MMMRARRRARLIARFGLALTVGVALWFAARHAPGVLARLEIFEVRKVEVVGARFLSEEEAVRASGVGDGASVWDDPVAWERGLASHPLVERARIRRRLPATLRFDVTENVPVALVSTPTLEPVDGVGRSLPIDPADARLDLPIVRIPDDEEAGGRSRTRVRALLAELERLDDVDPEFRARISVAQMNQHGDVIVDLLAPDVRVLYRPPVSARRLVEGMRALDDAAHRSSSGAPKEIDLRFADQVVVRFEGGR